MTNRLILTISDLQIPFEHQDALIFVKHVLKTFSNKDTKITFVNMGDEVDQHTLSKYVADPNGRSGGDELKEAIHHLRDWYKEFPQMYICESNHTYRVYKKAFDAGIPKEFMRSIQEVYEAPDKWKWNDRWIIDDVCFEHGEYVSGQTAAIRAALDNRMNTVIGHQHSWGGITYSNSIKDQIWGMNTGCLIDVEQYAFKYGKKLRKKPTLGTGIIFNGFPIFVPMILDKKGRWVGRI
jgi:hypothetical protein